VSAAVGETDGFRSIVASLEMHNRGSQQQEFVTTVQAPRGVLVSGFWLHIGEERVPGRLFEKKTALWVYRMIRDVTRRDPAVLCYTGPEHLELRVFPFAGGETRRVEIEFLFPANTAPALRVGDRLVEVPAAGPPLAAATAVGGAGGVHVLLPPDSNWPTAPCRRSSPAAGIWPPGFPASASAVSRRPTTSAAS
jgi:hypothetical protein